MPWGISLLNWINNFYLSIRPKEVDRMRRLALIVFTLLLAGGTVAWADAPAPSSSVIKPAINSYDTIIDFGQLVGITGTPEVCGLTRVPTRVRIENKTWTRQEMVPVIFCWASRTGKPVVGTQVAMAYWIRHNMVVALTNWQKRGNLWVLYPSRVWPIGSPDWGAAYSLDLQEVPLSADQLVGKIRKRTFDKMGRRIVPRQAPEFGCSVYPDPEAVTCNRNPAGTWEGSSLGFWVSPPWRSQDVAIFYDFPPGCNCSSFVAYDPSGLAR